MYVNLLHKIIVSCLCCALCACNTHSDTEGASQPVTLNTTQGTEKHQKTSSASPELEKLCYLLPERIDTFIKAYDTVKPNAKIDITFELKSLTITSFKNIPVDLQGNERTEHQKLLGKFFSAVQYMTRIKNIGAYRLDFYDDSARDKFCMRLRTNNTTPLNEIENEKQKLLYKSDGHQIFNKIIKSKKTAEIYFKTNNTLVFKNKKQAHGERALIIPKKQIYTLNHLKFSSDDASIGATTPHELLTGEMILNARKLAAEKYQKIHADILYHYKMFIKCHNCGLGFQSVYHIHLHLLSGRTPE